MRVLTLLTAALLLAGTTGCAKKDADTDTETMAEKSAPVATQSAQKPAQSTAPAAKKPQVQPGLSAADQERLMQTVASSFGKGSVKNKAGDTYSFTIEGSILKDQSSYGKFRFYSFQEGGKLDVNGDMTCVKINSPARQVWMAGKITGNASTAERFKSGSYAEGQYVYFRARPNSMKDSEQMAGAIEVPTFGDEVSATAFCESRSWSDASLITLGDNDLIAAIP